MKTRLTLLSAFVLLAVGSASAAMRYVDANNANPTPPYTNWATAAHVIQDAVDAAVAGDEIIVTNGLYATGGRAVYGTMTNRVAVTKPLTLRSVNGPLFTIIQGYQVPGTTNGEGAIRCVYLASGATLSGFTLTNGATEIGGGSQTDFERAGSGGGVWSESTDALVSNCVLTGNSARQGGGAFSGTLNACALVGNSAGHGGGVAGSHASFVLNNCTVIGNSTAGYGGGAFFYDVGGGFSGVLNNCVVAGNSAELGGGAMSSRLNNCTLTDNSASQSGGGAEDCRLSNCILYFNYAPENANYSFGSLKYCCTTPLPVARPWEEPFAGNISLDPQLASASHLSANSPCRGAGSAAYTSGTDIDSEAWANPPSIGCDEYRAGDVTGSLSVDIVAAFTSVAGGFPLNFKASIEGRTSASVWDFGDGTSATNQPYATHSWAVPGEYAVTLRAYNETQPAGISATVLVHVLAQPVHYVSVDSANPVPPYTSWETAAASIQDAVDAATAPGALVLVTNGVYATGGRAVHGTMTNRVAVTMPLTLRSVNGPQFTTIQGYQVPGTINGDGAIRCVYLTNGASLSEFTLANGATRIGFYDPESSGGGVWCESGGALVSNCVLTHNSASLQGGGTFRGTLNDCTLTGNLSRAAYGATLNNCTLVANLGGGADSCTLNGCALTGNSAQNGGGASLSVLNNCTLSGNSATYFGGGADSATLNNCTLTGNSASHGGGVSDSTVNNSIIFFNTAAVNGANSHFSEYSENTLNYCCTTPQPTNGVGNITLDPLLASASHLSAGSPCRGAGSAAYSTGTDIDGEPWATPPSIGCDEYHVGAVTGPLNVAISAPFTNVAVGYAAEFNSLVEGRTTTSVWEFGDGVVVSNRPVATHTWSEAGDYSVVLRAYNESLPGGVSATVTVHVARQPTHYVMADSANPLPPYASWATAARDIQDAVDAAFAGGEVVVTNGIYASGGRSVYGTITNRVAVDKPLTLRSVNGPQFTVIQGYQVPGTTNGDGSVRCVYLGIGASLSGFTLTNGATRGEPGDWEREQSGGGIWCEPASGMISNCVLTGNSAGQGGGVFRGTLENCTLSSNSASVGGGASGVAAGYYPTMLAPATLNNCTLADNFASQSGGGTYYGVLDNCTLAGNRANYGGGAYHGTLNNCVLTNNSALGDRGYGGGACDGTLNNCLLTRNSANLGGGAIATLNNCTLTANWALDGGGAFDGTLNNCVLTDNSAEYDGGGAWRATLNNCTLVGNSADRGGGAAEGHLSNCTLTGNSASFGGGFAGWESDTLDNCIVYFNTAPTCPNCNQDPLAGILNYCCTTPLPANGVGNLTNAPLFVDYAGGNLRLQSNSPCINAGNNACVSGPTDLDGLPRIVSGTVDIGAYEYQGPGSVISYAWLQQYGLPTDGSVDFLDLDGDGHTTWQEWRCQTCPTNALSALRLLSATPDKANVTVRWQSVAGVEYSLERSADLLSSPQFVPVASGIPGQPGTTAFTDTNAPGSGPFFYRVGVGN
jgi:PKD repeat protein